MKFLERITQGDKYARTIIYSVINININIYIYIYIYIDIDIDKHQSR